MFKKQQVLDYVERLYRNPVELGKFLTEMQYIIGAPCEPLAADAAHITALDYPRNCVVSGVVTGEGLPPHKAAIIVDNHGWPEMATSDFHGDFGSLSNMLDEILCQLNAVGVFITHGDNVTPVHDDQVPKDESLKILIALLYLIKNFPEQCFYLQGNHEWDAFAKFCSIPGE